VVIFFVWQFSLDINISDENEARKCQYLFLSTAEPCVLHIPLHNAHKGFWISKIGICNFVKNHSIPSTNLANLAVSQVYKKLGRCCFPTGQHMGICFCTDRFSPSRVGQAQSC
jgi:hypothetical protein